MKLSKTVSAKYYQENKERLQKKLVKDIYLSYIYIYKRYIYMYIYIKIYIYIYQNISKEEKENKQQYSRECYKNLSED